SARPLTPNAFLFELSAKDRRETMDKISKAIEEGYYDPKLNGVDWNAVRERYRPLAESAKTDEEFYTLMERMVGELHDAHTHVLTPAQARNFRNHERVNVGFNADVLDGKLVMTRVVPGSQAAQAGLEPGMIVQTVDGQPPASKVAEVAAKFPESSCPRATEWLRYGRVFMGEPGSTVKVGVERADGWSFEVALTRAVTSAAPDLVAKLLPSGNAYISFRIFYEPVAQEFHAALEKFKTAPGLIIDVRGNPGGSGRELMAIAANFFATKTVFARNKLRTRDTMPVSVGGKSRQMYGGPVVILADLHSGSSSELFAAGMQDAGRAKVGGSQPCGCVLGVNNLVDLKGGGAVMISKVLWFTPHDRKLEGEGVIPDKPVAITLADLRARQDPVLEAGDILLKEMSSAQLQKAGKQ